MNCSYAELNIRDLIKKAAPREDIDEGVIRKMELKYASQVSLALGTRNYTLALDVYDQASQLPATSTTCGLKLKGYQVNGPLFDGSNLVTCYKGIKSFVVKYLGSFEKKRLELLEGKCANVHPNIVPYELYTDDARNRTFMIMPKYITTLEPITSLDESDVIRLWTDISNALRFLHSKGIAFMDVKPSNICIESNKFILIDLGSVATFGTTSSCTKAFLPVDLHSLESADVIGSAEVDWWMLVSTIASKIGPEASLSQGPKRRTKIELISYLENNLPHCTLVTDLRDKLAL